MAGYSYSNDGDVSENNGSGDYWVVKLDAFGNIDWQKSLGGSERDMAQSIQQTTDGGYIVAGRSNSIDGGDVTGNHAGGDFWIVKLDEGGNITWQKSLGSYQDDSAYSINQTTDGGYIVAGSSGTNNGDVSNNHGDADYWIVKLDTLGNIDWQKSYGGSGKDIAVSIKQTVDSGYIVAGRSESIDGDVSGNHGDDDYWILKLDATGNINWQKSLGGSDTDQAYAIDQTSDGGYIVAGGSESNDGDVNGFIGTVDTWILKLDAAGNVIGQKSLGGVQIDYTYSITQTTNGGYILAGYSNSNDGDVSGNHGGKDYWIVKIGPFVGINELSSTTKELLRIVDLMGRETTFKPNTPLIYVYDDGSTERVYRVE